MDPAALPVPPQHRVTQRRADLREEEAAGGVQSLGFSSHLSPRNQELAAFLTKGHLQRARGKTGKRAEKRGRGERRGCRDVGSLICLTSSPLPPRPAAPRKPGDDKEEETVKKSTVF